MVAWSEMSTARPELASAGRELFYQVGVGLAFLSTVRMDGAPRLHPMCPIVIDDRICALIVPGPKCADLRREGRYALHSFPCDANEDAFMIAGRAEVVTDGGVRTRVVAQFLAERSGLTMTEADMIDSTLFEFGIDRVLLTRTTGHGDPKPTHTIWHAPG